MNVLRSLADLDEAVRRSHQRPILIFKHSLRCGRSAEAFEELQDFVALESATEVFVVAVQSDAPISHEIARRFGLRHESPQALIVHQGELVWHVSHSRVTKDEIAAARAAIR